MEHFFGGAGKKKWFFFNLKKKKEAKRKNSFCYFELIQEMKLPISYEEATFLAVLIQRLTVHVKASWLLPQSQKQFRQSNSPGRAVLKNVS